MELINYEQWKDFFNYTYDKMIHFIELNKKNILNLKIFLGMVYYLTNYQSNWLFEKNSKINYFQFYKIYKKIKPQFRTSKKFKINEIKIEINDKEYILNGYYFSNCINTYGILDFIFYNYLKYILLNDINYEDYKLIYINKNHSIDFNIDYLKKSIKFLDKVYYKNISKPLIFDKLKDIKSNIKSLLIFFPKKLKLKFLKLLVYLITFSCKLISDISLNLFEIIFSKSLFTIKITHNIYLTENINIKLENRENIKYIKIIKLITINEKNIFFTNFIIYKKELIFEIDYKQLINCKEVVIHFLNEELKIIKEKSHKFIIIDNIYQNFRLINISNNECIDEVKNLKNNLLCSNLYVIKNLNKISKNEKFIFSINNIIKSLNYNRKFKNKILKVKNNEELLIKRSKNKPILNFRDIENWDIFCNYINELTKNNEIKGILLNNNDFFVNIYNINYDELLKKDEDEVYHYSKKKIKSGFIIKGNRKSKNIFNLRKAFLIYLNIKLKNIQIFFMVNKFIYHNLSNDKEMLYSSLNEVKVIPIFNIKSKNFDLLWYKIYLCMLYKLRKFIYVIQLNKVYKILPKNVFISLKSYQHIEKKKYLIKSNEFEMIFNIHNNSKDYITVLGFKKDCFEIYLIYNIKNKFRYQNLLNFNLILDLKFLWPYVKKKYKVFEYNLFFKDINKEVNMVEFFKKNQFILDNTFFKEDTVKKIKVKLKKLNLKKFLETLDLSVKHFIKYNLKNNCYFVLIFKKIIRKFKYKELFISLLNLIEKKNLHYKIINNILKLCLPKFQKLFLSKIIQIKKQLFDELKEINSIKNIVILTTEFHNIIDVGGLAVMLENLVFELIEYKIKITWIMPQFIEINPNIVEKLKYIKDYDIELDRVYKISVYKYSLNDFFEIYFIREKNLFRKIYTFSNNYNIVQQITLFNKGAMDIIEDFDFEPELILTNDWYSSLFSFYLRKNNKIKSKIIHILHNLDYYYIGRIKLDEIEINNLKCYYSLHNIPLEHICELNNENIYLNFTKVCFFYIDNWASISNKYIEELIENKYYKDLIKINNFKPILINNGINKKYFIDYITNKLENLSKKDIKKYLFKKYFNLEYIDNYKLFGFLGRIVEQKGIIELLEGIKEFYKNNQSNECFFIIAGKGDRFSEYIKKIKAIFRELNIIKKNRIWFEPENFFQEKVELLYGCDFIIIPSLFEPCGIVQQESFACSTPVLANDTGGLSDTIDNLKNGIFFKNLTPVEISNKLIKCCLIIDNEILYKKMSNNAFNKCLSIKKTGKKWIKMIYQTCNLINIFHKVKPYTFKQNHYYSKRYFNLYNEILNALNRKTKFEIFKKIKINIIDMYNPFLKFDKYYYKCSLDSWKKKHKIQYDKNNKLYYINIPSNLNFIKFKINNGNWIILKNYSLEFDIAQNLNNYIL